ncbi:serine hydrolase [Draconibacterium sp. IB214405]|uniref:serine hydrolase domain-containing protein n=1 Tax=Draconibacterium sp. IB214405 TaxID=3097352 RepID=UPI002A0B4A7D|nr:serine hydrolase [Draconibacterium sp. IB214405]MDX8339659.1 serine hydrolase [Draconibacterium sp. IB214405]
MFRFVSLFVFVAFCAACTPQNKSNSFAGFWEGPHPEDPNKKFYVQILDSDSTNAKGYWTDNGFYDSGFQIDSLKTTDKSIRFFVPNWNCTYLGEREGNFINGGFACEGDPFDSVRLVKNDKISRFLTDALPGCHEKDFKYHCQTPIQHDDLLQTSRIKRDGDSIFIYSLVPEIINGEYGRLNSFLLIKNNQLICEEYFYGFGENTLHQAESTTKSITSLLNGIAVDKGFVTDLNESVATILEAPDFDKWITLKHLLTMTSGLTPNDEELHFSNDRIKTILSRELNYEPGTKFQYDGGNTELLGAIIKKKTGMYADEFAREYLFEPLLITQYNWEIGKQNGYSCMAGSLEITPRELAKIGMLVLNKGKFNGQQVVSEEWIEQSTSSKTHTNVPEDDYAYQWWNLTLKAKGEEYPCIWANGFGSQFIYIFPTLDAVIVTTGHNYEFDSWAITSGIEKYLYLLDWQ